MPETACPVNDLLENMRGFLEAPDLDDPKSRRLVEEIGELLEDIAWGRAGAEHVAAVAGLAGQLVANANDEGGRRAGEMARNALNNHHEDFESHVRTHNCPTGDCVVLAPAPCQMTCPAGIDVPTYVTLIGMGKYAEAVDVIRRDNPFPWVCGLVCTRPCEFMCVRGRMDRSVSIKALKAFASERALSQGRYTNPEPAEPQGKKVCVVGAGPAGLTAAYYLALKGYGVTVVEDLPAPGGMMMVGIPRYRLPREVIDREVAMIQELGVEIRYSTRFGRDVTFESLREEGHDAFFIAIGAHQSWKLDIPGEDVEGVVDAVTFLKRVALGDRRPPGASVVVVGGGNVAIDAARTCLRLGCKSVTVAYRRSRAEMPADVEEVEQAEEEGVRFSFLTVPTEVVAENGHATALRAKRAELVAVEGSSRKRPLPVEGSDHDLPADVIIPAIGQRVDEECLLDIEAMDWTRRRTVCVDMASMETTAPGVFAAGDAVTGPATVVEAIGGGKRAAEAIDRYLSGIPQPKSPPVPKRRMRLPAIEATAAERTTKKRAEMPLLPIDRRRTTFQQVELGLTEEMARAEALRCLRCDICRRCGECVRVCRDMMGVNALELGYMDFDRPEHTDLRVTAQRCIECGACAQNCPNQAMVMSDEDGERVLRLCGTELNRQPLAWCETCGEVLGPSRYLDFVKNRTQGTPTATGRHLLCEKCARTASAQSGAEQKVPPPGVKPD
ncbi:MAG: NAD(P)-binding protein [Desulfatibacillaceae bacterium]